MPGWFSTGAEALRDERHPGVLVVCHKALIHALTGEQQNRARRGTAPQSVIEDVARAHRRSRGRYNMARVYPPQ